LMAVCIVWIFSQSNRLASDLSIVMPWTCVGTRAVPYWGHTVTLDLLWLRDHFGSRRYIYFDYIYRQLQ
jgi:hypothetical protein